MPLLEGEVYARIHTATRLHHDNGTTIDDPPDPQLPPDLSWVAVARTLIEQTPPEVLVRNAGAEPDEFPWRVRAWRINDPPTTVRAPTDIEAFLGSSTPLNPEDQEIMEAADDIANGSKWTLMPLSGEKTLSNVGSTYDANATSQRLPHTVVFTDRIVEVALDIRVIKVGSGVQSWQLWDDDIGAEVAVIDDNTAAGATPRVGRVVVPYVPVPGAIRRWRLRAKSTIAADDPIFLSAVVGINELIETPLRRLAAGFRDIHSRRSASMTVYPA
jgi:hypothetical protein